MSTNKINAVRIQYKNKLVAFLDILGFREKVFQDQSKAIETIQHIQEAISHTIKIIKSDSSHVISIKLFSDCFCLSCDHNNISLLIEELSFLQLFLSNKNIFVRGSLSAGLHFESPHTIFSEGLIKAYDLQLKNRFPRVTIDEIIVKKMQEDNLVESLMVAPDGSYFIDYLQSLTMEGMDGVMDELLEGHKRAILKEVKLNSGNFPVIEKYKWLAEYHNMKFPQLYGLDDYDEEYQHELLERLSIQDTIFPSFKAGRD